MPRPAPCSSQTFLQRIKAIVVPVWAVGCLTLSSAAEPEKSEQKPVRLQSEITGVQPMTGIVLWSDNERAASHPEAISLEYRYCGYDEVVQPDGRYDFTHLDAVLDEIAARNHQAILRFYFCYVGKKTTVPQFVRAQAGYEETIGLSEKQQTHFCDWSHPALQEFALTFYTKLAARYDNDPRIAFLQTGFGLWGEYHIYSGPRQLGTTFPDKAFQAKFLHHLAGQFDNLPWSISIDAADFDYSPLEDNRRLLDLPFGVFDDSFLCKPHPRENAVNWRILDARRWQRQPGGGEFSYYNKKDQRNALAAGGPNGVSFEQAARQFHITYMIGNDQPRYQSMDRIRQAGMATGYRFRVTKATTGDGHINLTVTNEGVAPLYRDAWFARGKQRAKTSLKGLLPGESRDCRIALSGNGDVPLTIECDAILPGQKIQFAADLP
ncbi:MAG: DUF4832 domain-containing protein [Planctomycetaceae bacterium]|nr:DUF4832 domain-containing protein [Planctomycetaceae bacterium]